MAHRNSSFFILHSSFVPWLALAGFAALAAAFVQVASSFRANVIDWARRDLDARAELAAGELAEPLATQDFRLIREHGDRCRGEGYRLEIRSASGGRVYDTLEKGADGSRFAEFGAERRSGEYRVLLSVSSDRVLAPFHRSLPVFALAFLVGITGMLFVFFAFYRQRARLREQARRLDDLARLERERAEFIADFSHELKTPLTGIIAAAEMLGAGTAADGGQTGVLAGMVTKEAKRLNSLAQQILDLSRLEKRQNGSDPDCRNGSAGTVAGPRAEELVARAVDELVANAKRHSGSDEVSVREETSGGMHRWIVEDRGAGVPEELREKIFERFFRADPSRAAESGGAGLGLAIVRRIARNLGGDCVCGAAEPRGARFTLRIPETALSN